MIDRSMPVTEDELHAFVDGELSADRRDGVDAWLATHPDDAARVATWRAQADAIRARYDSVAAEPVPARLALDRITARQRTWRSAVAIAATIAFLIGGIGGGIVGWISRASIVGAPPDTTHAADAGFTAYTADAIEAYKLYVVEVRHPVEVPAADAEHLVQWLSKRVGYQLRAPNLDSVGLKLVGGRLLPGPTGPAAFFMYENASGERYTLYCGRTQTPAMALRYNNGDAASAVYWSSDDIAYVISGKGDREQLHNVAVAAHEQIEAPVPAKSGG
ncbi:MAG: anti-sigma factor family protein [Xanthobacteraceae bacterium]